MRHAKRDVLATQDIEDAFRLRNIEVSAVCSGNGGAAADQTSVSWQSCCVLRGGSRLRTSWRHVLLSLWFLSYLPSVTPSELVHCTRCTAGARARAAE